MKRLDVSALELQELLDMCEKHRQNFGDFIQAALKLHSLEGETGKEYGPMLTLYEKTKAEQKELEKQGKETLTNLNKQKKQVTSDLAGLKARYDEARNRFKILNEKSSDAQQVLDSFESTKKELAAFGLQVDDFEAVRKFLSEICRLGGKPMEALKILKEASSLEAKLQERQRALDSLRRANKEETQSHYQLIKILDRKKEEMEEEIIAKEKTLGELKTAIFDTTKKLEIEFTEGSERMHALEQQVDGLLKRQAEMLRVQPDIDLVCEALPVRRKELEESERKIKENEMLIAGATAISNLLSNKPTYRNAIIQFLQMTKKDTGYTSYDKMGCQAMVRIMAKQGFVQKAELEVIQKIAENETQQAQEDAKTWHNIAEKRLKELEKCRAQQKQERNAKDKALDKQINGKIVNVLTELAKKA
jgi:hypothetical protein